MLSEIDDVDLRARLTAEVTARGLNRPFGLLFEDTVEEIDLVDASVRRGDRVQYRAGGPERLEVLAVKDGVATLRPMMEGHRGRWLRDPDGETITVPVADVMVTVDHDSKVYPGLVQTGAAGETSPGRPTHVAIAGENLHTLRALKYSHRASVDLIYIDPPYNTGNKDWVYNDRWVDSNDAFRHSKWLAFMRRRLRLAHDLLKDTGVIIVAIGDDEQHRLRMLMDEVFGEGNFISNIVWQGGRKNDSRFVSNGADYMLVYTREKSVWSVTGVKAKEAPTLGDLTSDQIKERGARWWERKPGGAEALAAAQEIWSESESHAEAQKRYRAWMRAFKKTGVPTDAVSRFTTLDASGSPIRTDRDISWPGGDGHFYDLLHPVTGQPCEVPSTGWRFAQDKMAEEIAAGNIYFGPDHSTQPGGITRLAELEEQVAESVFVMDRNKGATHLHFKRKGTGVFNDKRFENPKDHAVLMRWFRMMAPRDAVILDFFGGSGSTAEAVMRLNAEDGGTRQCILVTNNEVAASEEKKLKKAGHLPGSHEWKAAGVFERVTRPRLTTILTGERDDGSVYDSPVGGEHSQCVEFFDLTYVSPRRARLNLEWKRLAPLLWMRGGALGGIPARADKPYVVTEGFAAMWGGDHAKDLAAELTDQRVVFIVTDSEAEFVAAAKHFDGFECRHLWNDYLGEN